MKNKKIALILHLLAVVMLLNVSCKKETEEMNNPNENPENLSFDDLEVQDGFTWNTSKFLQIDLTFVNNNEDPVSTDFEVYSEYPNGIKFMVGTSKTDGTFSRNYKIAAYRKNFTVVLPGQEPVVVEFTDTNLSVGDTETEGYKAHQTIVVENPVFKSITEDTYQYYPAEGKFGTIAFEDNWPHGADYDFNDVVLDYNVMATLNEDDYITAINMVLYLRASGANSQDGNGNGVGISFKHSWSWAGPYPDIGTVTVNGENIQQENTVYPSFILIPNVEDYQPTYNTFSDQAFVYPSRFEVEIIFNTPAEDWWEVDMPLNNIFIFDSQDRGRETHLPWYLPTSLANSGYVGIGSDASDEFAFNPNNFKAGNMIGFMTYMTEDYYPWAINVYFDEGEDDLFCYPVEFSNIREAYYPAFDGWVEYWDPEEWYLPEYHVEGEVYEILPDPDYPEMN